jgi:hypothetical protein
MLADKRTILICDKPRNRTTGKRQNQGGAGIKLARKISVVLKILGLVLGIVSIIFGFNEATADVLDQIGSNYWLAYCAVISGIALIVVVLILSKRPKK